MADRSMGEIQIGGRVPRKLFSALVEKLREAGLVCGEVADVSDLLVAGDVDAAGCLSFDDPEAAGGMFDDLEFFLREHGIHFDRQAGSSYAYDGEDVYYRGEVAETNSKDKCGTLYAALREVRAALVRGDAVEALQVVNVVSSGDVELLAPIEFVDE